MNLFFKSYLSLKLLLDISYIYIVNNEFAGEGYPVDVSIEKYFESWILLILILFTIPHRTKKPSNILVNVLTVFIIIPILSFYGLTEQKRIFLYSLLIIYIPIIALNYVKNINIPALKIKYNIIKFNLIGYVFLISMWMLWSSPVFTLDLSILYDYREIADNEINNGILAYLTTWAFKVVGPILMVIFLISKKYINALLVIILHVIWFALTTHKSVILFPLLIFGFWLIFQRSSNLYLIPILAIIPIVIGMTTYYLFDDIWASSILIRRAFFVPASLSFVYLEFFEKMPFIYWSDSILSSLISYPYSENPAIIIGNYSGTGAWANNSFISSGYMHAGIVGVVLYSFILFLLLYIIDSISNKNVNPSHSCSFVLAPFVTMYVSADLPTSLLTHGILFSIFILWTCKYYLKNSH